MDADERDICTYLKSWPGEFISAKDIGRRAGGKWRYRENPDWAAPVLARLVEQGFVEANNNNEYRLVRSEKEPVCSKRPISPHIQKILEQSGKTHLIKIEPDVLADEK